MLTASEMRLYTAIRKLPAFQKTQSKIAAMKNGKRFIVDVQDKDDIERLCVKLLIADCIDEDLICPVVEVYDTNNSLIIGEYQRTVNF